MSLDNVDDIYPLTAVQKGMLAHTLSEPESGVYVQQICSYLQGNLCEDLLKAAWDRIMSRHAALRTVFLTEGLEQPVSPGSTVGGCLIVNCIKAEVAKRLIDAGQPPKALAAGNILGGERAAEVFEAAYDEHANRLAKLFENVGKA